MRGTTGHMVTHLFGDSVILVPRAAVIDTLAARAPIRRPRLGRQ